MKKNKLKLNFKSFAIKIEKPWGYELLLSDADSKVTSKILHVLGGKRLSLQYHDKKEEVLSLISGEGFLELENTDGDVQKIKMEVRKGYRIAPNQIHRISAGVGDCEIFESSTPELGNTIRLEDDYNRGTESEKDRKILRKK